MKPPRPHASHLRRGRFSECGRVYLITTVIHQRQTPFQELPLARLAIQELQACDASADCQTLAFVLMPDHLHWLLTLHRGDLSALVRRFKSNSARRINTFRGSTGPLWQAGFHDHTPRQEDDLRRLARYVVANPLRSGLVESIGDYPHWDALWLTT